MKLNSRFFYLLIVTILPINYHFPAIAETKTKRETITKPADPPPKIPPNKVKPGGGLDLFQQSCSQATESLRALVPVDNPVVTTRTHPTWLFYVPDSPKAISNGEFTLVTADEKLTLYSQQFAIDNTPGILRLQLPNDDKYALESDQFYHWYFKLHCASASNSQNYVDVHGWIHKIAVTSDTENQINNASPQIWYDSLASVADNLTVSPQNSRLQQQWHSLLSEIDLEHLSTVSDVVFLP